VRRAPLQAEADTTLTDNNGDTALQHAEAEGHESVAQLIRLHEVEEGVTSWPRPEFRLEAPQISFINLPDSGPNLQKIRLKIPACS